MRKILFVCLAATTSIWGQVAWERFKEDTISSDLPLIPGWCSKELADHLMEFIYREKPLLSVEIGAFGGSTTYPIAQALKFLGDGILYAIDAWDHQAVLKGFEPHHPHTNWWNSMGINMDFIHNYLDRLLLQRNLSNYCFPVQMLSEEACPLFLEEQIDFLFIDGNCSVEGSLQDVSLYYPKVKKGGYIWLNQADLPTKNKATTFLMQRCEWIREESMGVRCLVFKKT
jgi:predicted O-methyltransferase YrrM